MNNLVSVGILLSLMSDGKTSSRVLAEKFEISTKTVFRYVESLILAGVPIVCTQGKKGGIEISPDYVLNNNYLSDSEILSICTLLNGSCLKKMNSGILTALDKLKATLKMPLSQLASPVIIDDLPWGSKLEQSQTTTKLIEAAQANDQLEITYQKNNAACEKRVVNPYCVVFKDGFWYLYAFCTMRNSFRLFKCSRILSITKTGKIFERLPVELSNKPWLNSTGIGEIIDISLEISPSILNDLVEWLPSTTIKYKTENSIIISASALYNSGLVTRLLSYRNQITVLSPSMLARDVKKACDLIALNYQ